MHHCRQTIYGRLLWKQSVIKIAPSLCSFCKEEIAAMNSTIDLLWKEILLLKFNTGS